MKKKYLPIGTVVLLRGAQKKIMIIGYYPISENIMYDFVGCIYPEGMIDANKSLLFNYNQIEKIFYQGYETDEFDHFVAKLDEIVQVKKSTDVDVG